MMFVMRLEGWNHIPTGYGMSMDPEGAPLWLRIWFRVPLLDRFAYPLMVRRGGFYLTRQPDWPEDELEPLYEWWRVVTEG